MGTPRSEIGDISGLSKMLFRVCGANCVENCSFGSLSAILESQIMPIEHLLMNYFLCIPPVSSYKKQLTIGKKKNSKHRQKIGLS